MRDAKERAYQLDVVASWWDAHLEALRTHALDELLQLGYVRSDVRTNLEVDDPPTSIASMGTFGWLMNDLAGRPLAPAEFACSCIDGDPYEGECVPCGVALCKHGEPLDCHHDGCPACEYEDENTAAELAELRRPGAATLHGYPEPWERDT